MATSNSRNFNLNRDQIIIEAFREIGFNSEETLSDAHTQEASRVLNTMIKSWQAMDIGLWNVKEGILFTEDAENTYTLSLTGDHVTQTYVATTTTVAAVAAATTLTVASVTGMAASDNIGIQLDSGARQWTTISSIAGLVITIAAGLTSAAASGNTVVTYTSKINRPIEITQVRKYDLDTLTESEISLIHRDEYYSLTKKTQEGLPAFVYYDKQLASGTLKVWPACDDVNVIIKFTYYDEVEDFDAATDDPDFPSEWFEALILGLAYRLARRFGMAQILEVLRLDSDIAFNKIRNFNVEYPNIQFSPNMDNC